MAAYGMSRRFAAVKKLDAVERKADIPQPSPTGPSGENDPNVWSGRALQENFFELADVRSCINVSGL
jgi:hypothetical protein